MVVSLLRPEVVNFIGAYTLPDYFYLMRKICMVR